MENRIAYQETDRLAAEINVIKQQTARTLLIASIEIGERLTRAKSIIPHGEWESWLKENVDYSQSTAQGFMKVYREYGGDQMNISGNTPLEIFGNLTYTQALALLGLPPEERERFVKENDVEEMSTRELQKAVAEVKAAKEEAEAERRRAESVENVAAERIAAAEKQLSESRVANDKLLKEKEAAKQSADAAEAELAKLREEIEKINAPRELSEEEKAAVEREIAKKFEAQINQMSITIEAAEANAARLNEEKTAIEEKYKKTANAELVKFQTLFEKFQNDTKELVTLADRIGGEQGEKLKGVLKKTTDLLIGE